MSKFPPAFRGSRLVHSDSADTSGLPQPQQCGVNGWGAARYHLHHHSSHTVPGNTPCCYYSTSPMLKRIPIDLRYATGTYLGTSQLSWESPRVTGCKSALQTCPQPVHQAVPFLKRRKNFHKSFLTLRARTVSREPFLSLIYIINSLSRDFIGRESQIFSNASTDDTNTVQTKTRRQSVICHFRINTQRKQTLLPVREREDETPLWDDKEMQDYLMHTMNVKKQHTGDMN